MRTILPIAAALALAGCASPSVNQSGESSEPHDTGSGSNVECLGNASATGTSSENVTGADAYCGNGTRQGR